MTQEKYEEALRSADELIEARPDTFEGYHYKFITLLGLERAEEGNQVLETAMELFTDDIGFVYDRIKYYEHIEDYNAALKLIEERFPRRAARIPLVFCVLTAMDHSFHYPNTLS